MQCSAGVQLKVHEPTVQLMKEHYAKTGKEVNEARLRMATLPEGAEVSNLQKIQPQASNAHDFRQTLLLPTLQHDVWTSICFKFAGS